MLNLKYINLTKRRHQKQRFFHPQGFVVVLKVIDGVDVTNSSNYYIKPNDASEYYGSVLGATIYKKGETKTFTVCACLCNQRMRM